MPVGGAGGAGSCFGFDVHTDVELRYLRDGCTGDRLHVRAGASQEPETAAPLLEWRYEPGRTLDAHLHALDDGSYRLWIGGAGGGWFTIDTRASRIDVPAGGDPLRREERIWGVPVALCLLERGFLPLHAACVEVDGRAVAVAGSSRAGKTTLAGALVAAGARLLSEDLTVLAPGSGDRAAIPGPAMLRIRRDMVDALGLGPANGVHRVAEDEERVHFAVDAGGRGTCAPVELAGIVLLRDGAAPTLTPADPVAVLPELWSLSFHLPRDTDRAECFQRLADLSGDVPILEFHRPVRVDAVPDAVATVFGYLRGAR